MGEEITRHNNGVSRQGCGPVGKFITGLRTQGNSGHREVLYFKIIIFGQGEQEAASVMFSYLRVDLKDRALGREKRRESCELLADGAA